MVGMFLILVVNGGAAVQPLGRLPGQGHPSRAFRLAYLLVCRRSGTSDRPSTWSGNLSALPPGLPRRRGFARAVFAASLSWHVLVALGR